MGVEGIRRGDLEPWACISFIPAAILWAVGELLLKPSVYFLNRPEIILETCWSAETARTSSCLGGGRRVILIQCHLAHPSVWPWNPGICSLLLLGFVRWQAKTLKGGPWSTLCCVLRTHTGATCVLRKPSRTWGKGGQALAKATLFVEVAQRRGGDSMSQRTHWGPLCRPPGSAACATFSQEGATLLLGSRFTKSHCQIASNCRDTGQRSKPQMDAIYMQDKVV